MSKYRMAYAPEFRQQLIELVHAGRSANDVAKRVWPACYDGGQVDAPEPDGHASGNAAGQKPKSAEYCAPTGPGPGLPSRRELAHYGEEVCERR